MKNKKNDFIKTSFEKFLNFFNEVEVIKNFLVPIHSAGYPFILIFIVVTLIVGSMSDLLGWIGIILTLWCVYFFRDPIRVVPIKNNIIVSPADGIFLPVVKSAPPKELKIEKKMNRVSIFMNVFNVHVNRIPIEGKIIQTIYHPGAFFNASLDKASSDNERMTIKMKLKNGKEIVIVQIAGLIARRIKCDVSENQTVKTGEKFGIIRFGSRVDVYLPIELPINILEGQIAVGGETLISELGIQKIQNKISKEKTA